LGYDGEIVIGTRIDSEGLKEDLKGIKKEFEGGKISKRIGKDDIGEPFVEGIKVAINNSSYKVKDSVKKVFEELELQKKMGVVSEEEYYNKLEQLRDQYFAKGTKEWWNYTAKIVQYETKVYEDEQRKIEKIFSQLDKNVEKSVSSYEKNIEALEKKTESFSSKLFDNDLLTTVSMNFGKGDSSQFIDGVWKRKSADIVMTQLKDLKGEIKILEEYGSLLNEFVNKENMPYGMSELLKGYSAKDGVDYMRAVLSLSDDEYNSYISDFNRKNKLSDDISKIVYNSEAQSIKEEFLKELSENFKSVDEEFLKCGIDAATAFGDSFSQKIGEVLENVKTYIQTELQSIECSFSINEGEKGANTLVYNLYGSGETTAQKLQAARMDAELESLRGGY